MPLAQELPVFQPDTPQVDMKSKVEQTRSALEGAKTDKLTEIAGALQEQTQQAERDIKAKVEELSTKETDSKTKADTQRSTTKEYDEAKRAYDEYITKNPLENWQAVIDAAKEWVPDVESRRLNLEALERQGQLTEENSFFWQWKLQYDELTVAKETERLKGVQDSLEAAKKSAEQEFNVADEEFRNAKDALERLRAYVEALKEQSAIVSGLQTAEQAKEDRVRQDLQRHKTDHAAADAAAGDKLQQQLGAIGVTPTQEEEMTKNALFGESSDDEDLEEPEPKEPEPKKPAQELSLAEPLHIEGDTVDTLCLSKKSESQLPLKKHYVYPVINGRDSDGNPHMFHVFRTDNKDGNLTKPKFLKSQPVRNTDGVSAQQFKQQFTNNPAMQKAIDLMADVKLYKEQQKPAEPKPPKIAKTSHDDERPSISTGDEGDSTTVAVEATPSQGFLDEMAEYIGKIAEANSKLAAEEQKPEAERDQDTMEHYKSQQTLFSKKLFRSKCHGQQATIIPVTNPGQPPVDTLFWSREQVVIMTDEWHRVAEELQQKIKQQDERIRFLEQQADMQAQVIACRNPVNHNPVNPYTSIGQNQLGVLATTEATTKGVQHVEVTAGSLGSLPVQHGLAKPVELAGSKRSAATAGLKEANLKNGKGDVDVTPLTDPLKKDKALKHITQGMITTAMLKGEYTSSLQNPTDTRAAMRWLFVQLGLTQTARTSMKDGKDVVQYLKEYPFPDGKGQGNCAACTELGELLDKLAGENLVLD